MKEQREVERELKKLSKVYKPGKWKPESYIGGGQSSLKYLNLKVPHVRNAAKTGYSFSKRPIEEQWKIWDQIWRRTKYFEVALSAVHFVNSRPIEELLPHRENLIEWQERIDNWALSDELSSCYSRILEVDRSKMLPVFKRWNRSKDPWKRRQSMVGLLFYSRARKKPLGCDQVFSFVEPHLHDDHYYVQKGVGWTLRECWNLYPEKTFAFLKRHAANIPPAGWTAATEKLSRNDKRNLMKIRKNQ